MNSAFMVHCESGGVSIEIATAAWNNRPAADWPAADTAR